MTAPAAPAPPVELAPVWLERWPTRDVRWPLDREVLTIGRAPTADVRIADDALVSRVHARLERVAGTWTVVDDGFSRNGTFLEGRRVTGRQPLHDGDVLRVGATSFVLVDPGDAGASTEVAAPLLTAQRLTPAQRAVLQALCRPYAAGGPCAAPASNAVIAAELFISVETVKTHLRDVCQRLGLDHLPPQQKRLRLVATALDHGLVSLHELRGR